MDFVWDSNARVLSTETRTMKLSTKFNLLTAVQTPSQAPQRGRPKPVIHLIGRRCGAASPTRGAVRASQLAPPDRDPVRGLHQGQRSHPPGQLAGHMTAPRKIKRSSNKSLHKWSRPHMTPPDHGITCKPDHQIVALHLKLSWVRLLTPKKI